MTFSSTKVSLRAHNAYIHEKLQNTLYLATKAWRPIKRTIFKSLILTLRINDQFWSWLLIRKVSNLVWHEWWRNSEAILKSSIGFNMSSVWKTFWFFPCSWLVCFLENIYLNGEAGSPLMLYFSYKIRKVHLHGPSR